MGRNIDTGSASKATDLPVFTLPLIIPAGKGLSIPSDARRGNLTFELSKTA
jgi:hypothetical protein